VIDAEAKSSTGPTSLTEMARLTGEFADWNNLHYVAVWLTGELNVAALRDAWWRTCLRHDVLRRTYDSAEEARTYEDALSEVEFHTAPSDAEAVEIMCRFVGTPFSLSGPGFSRIAVVQRDERRHLLGIAVDHIINDLVSWFRLHATLTEFYNLAVTGRKNDVTEAHTYRDFAAEQRRLFVGGWGDERRAFWHSYAEQFGTFPPPFTVGAEHTGEYRRESIVRPLPADARAQLHDLSVRARATPFAVATASVLAAARRVTGETVVGVSTNQHGRTLPSTSQTLGLFVQTVPVHLGRHAGGQVETVREVFSRTLDVFEYSVPLLVAGRYWNETLMVPDQAAGIYVGLNEEPPADYRMPPLIGLAAEPVELTFPGGKRWPETVIVAWNLYETAPELVARYNDNYFPRAAVEQLLDAAEKFALQPGK
jgi:hypothetical protein